MEIYLQFPKLVVCVFTEAIFNTNECLKSDKFPELGVDCDFCQYPQVIKTHEK